MLGPALGGALAQPCESYPTLFSRGTIFDQFPFLLPNLVCAVVLGFGVLIGILFLEETHEDKKYRRDVGLELGAYILKYFRKSSDDAMLDKDGHVMTEESLTLLEDEPPPGYRTTEASPRDPSSRSHSPNVRSPPWPLKDETRPKCRSPGVRKAFTKQVWLNIVGYGILA